MKMDHKSNKGFTHVQDIEDIRYGRKTKLYQNPSTGHQYLCIEKLFNGQEEAENIATEIQRKMKNPNLYYVPI
jgi:actin-related protein